MTMDKDPMSASDTVYTSPTFVEGVYYEDDRFGYDADLEYYDDGDEVYERKRKNFSFAD